MRKFMLALALVGVFCVPAFAGGSDQSDNDPPLPAPQSTTVTPSDVLTALLSVVGVVIVP